jgi:hypothetical protein
VVTEKPPRSGMVGAKKKSFPCAAPSVPKVPFEVAPDREPWARQPGETQKQYAAFVVYRDLGLGARSIPATAKALGLSTRSGQVGGWSSRNSWRERVDAWDREIERKKQIALTDEVQEMARRHVAAAQNYIEVLMEPARLLARHLKDPQFRDLEDLPTPQLLMLAARCARVLPSLMQAECVARGEPTVGAQPPTCATGDLFQRIAQYSSAFERILAQTASGESGSQTAV